MIAAADQGARQIAYERPGAVVGKTRKRLGKKEDP